MGSLTRTNHPQLFGLIFSGAGSKYQAKRMDELDQIDEHRFALQKNVVSIHKMDEQRYLLRKQL